MNFNEYILISLFNEFCKEKYKITHLKDVLIEEEYIDLIPILKNLYIDAAHFLKPIKEVRLAYGQN